MKKFLIFLMCFILHSSMGAGFCNEVPVKSENFKTIYDSLIPADFEYIFSLDPYQSEDYQKYIASPYPLLRTGVDFYFKGAKIPAGYYLLTPREKNGTYYVLFKQEGKVKYIIPTYKKELVDPIFYNKYIPIAKKTAWQKACDAGNSFVAMVSKQSKKTIPPKVYIDVNQVGGEFWQVILYYGNDKYFMVFSQK